MRIIHGRSVTQTGDISIAKMLPIYILYLYVSTYNMQIISSKENHRYYKLILKKFSRSLSQVKRRVLLLLQQSKFKAQVSKEVIVKIVLL